MAPKLRSLSIRGFRAFGRVEQTLNLPADLVVVWGPNSKGKTSLAEAIEFLLTGRISRRELMASTQDEFADSLRNAHLPAGEEVYVAARVAADGKDHDVRRILLNDYGKREDCRSRLEIDGRPASQEDLAALGFALSQPPLQAPVLAQHTLGYIFSVRPQDRATYFKTLLEVTDLDDLRASIAALAESYSTPPDALLSKFDACIASTVLRPSLAPVARLVTQPESFLAGISDAARALIEGAGHPVPEPLSERLSAIEVVLADRRSKTFQMQAFARKPLAGWDEPSETTWASLDTYLVEREKVDAETRRLSTLFHEALELPAVAAIAHPIDCPLCASPAALTPERVHLLRAHVENTSSFKTAEAAANGALARLSTSVEALISAVDATLPQYLKGSPANRKKTGFTLGRIRALLEDTGAHLIDPWLAQIRPLARAATTLRRKARKARALIHEQTATTAKLDSKVLREVFADLALGHSNLATAAAAYDASAQPLIEALNRVLDELSDTSGWQDFLDIARQPDLLRAALLDRAALASLQTELASALTQIDRAKERVLEDKFADYSDLIQAWWERLRPDEPTFFSAVKPRKGAKRTIDFKAGLSANPDRSAPKLRDVIAVFSQSQLHCLGLALFLARAQHEGLGFIVLDDPVLSSDEDYRVHFNSTVLTELLQLSVQVVVLTQVHDTWEELETRYRHLGIATAQLFVETAAEGSVIENTSDALLAKLSRADSLARGGHPDSRKECGVQLRDAGERFCKEMLVNDRRAKGDMAASLSDYDGKTLEWLCPRIDPLLDKDPSHPGKLSVFKNTVNRACHDNTPPGNAEMRQACGDLRRFTKDYLGR